MSDYHILSSRPDGNALTVVMHFAVPDINNEVGVNYRVALLESMEGTPTSQVPFIDPAELAQIEAGEIFEWALQPMFSTHPGETLINKRDRMDALWASECTKQQQRLQAKLQFWGYSRDVS